MRRSRSASSALQPDRKVLTGGSEHSSTLRHGPLRRVRKTRTVDEGKSRFQHQRMAFVAAGSSFRKPANWQSSRGGPARPPGGVRRGANRAGPRLPSREPALRKRRSLPLSRPRKASVFPSSLWIGRVLPGPRKADSWRCRPRPLKFCVKSWRIGCRGHWQVAHRRDAPSPDPELAARCEMHTRQLCGRPRFQVLHVLA